jgi:biopolymer transport protein ExbD
MITRPLDLASRLRPAPAGQDTLWFVNVGALVLFFMFFGSRFVLAPGLAIELPEAPGVVTAARAADTVITVRNADMVFAQGGVMPLARLGTWLKQQAAGRRGLVLLVLADARLPGADLAEIVRLADAAGYQVQWAAQPAENRTGKDAR